MEKKLLFMTTLLVMISAIFFTDVKQDQKNISISLVNIEALASEVSFDFCVYTNDICVIYDDGFAIKGYLQYSITV
jgi:hypothetical protein